MFFGGHGVNLQQNFKNMAVFLGGLCGIIGDPEKKAKELIKLFKSKKYTITKGAVSNTQAGKSVYFYIDYKKK